MGSTLVRNWFAHATLTRHFQVDAETFKDPEFAPVPGTEHDWNSSEWAATYDTVPDGKHYLYVPETQWGDRSDTAIFHRSNYLALLQDYPNTFVQIEDNHDRWLMLPFDSTIPDTLAEAMDRLQDYPIYDEDHHSQLQMDLLTEQFNDRQFDGDFVYELNGLLCGDRSEYVAYDDFRCTESWLKDQFWKFHRNYDGEAWYEHSAEEIYFTDEFIEAAAAHVADLIEWDWTAKVTWLDTRQEGLF